MIYVIVFFFPPQVKECLDKKGLVLVGWYHSHPISEAKPSQCDIVSQKQFQDSLRRDNGDEPCIGFILSMNFFCCMFIVLVADYCPFRS